jgi:hypothetical protein
VRIFKNRWFEKFALKQEMSDAALIKAIDRAEVGLIDADLGGGIIKQRVARKGEGKSGGYRTVVAFRSGDRALFLFGFAKSDRASLSTAELAEFRAIGRAFLKAKAPDVERAVAKGVLSEVRNDEGL